MSSGSTKPAIAVGTVIKAALPPQQGIEQHGNRPAIVMAMPHVPGPSRFPLLVVVPFTSDKAYTWANANPALYPIVPAGVGGLTADSVALLDQVRAVDPMRVTAILGTLDAAQMQPIRDGLRALLRL